MKIIIDIRDYRGIPMGAEYWPALLKDGLVKDGLELALVNVIRSSSDIPSKVDVYVTWEESK